MVQGCEKQVLECQRPAYLDIDPDILERWRSGIDVTYEEEDAFHRDVWKAITDERARDQSRVFPDDYTFEEIRADFEKTAQIITRHLKMIRNSGLSGTLIGRAEDDLEYWLASKGEDLWRLRIYKSDACETESEIRRLEESEAWWMNEIDKRHEEVKKLLASRPDDVLSEDESLVTRAHIFLLQNSVRLVRESLQFCRKHLDSLRGKGADEERDWFRRFYAE